MKLTIREQATCSIIGLVGMGIPAQIINHFTYNVAPHQVIGGIIIAGLVGYGFGAWTMSRAYREENEVVEELPDVSEVQL